jgi:hypothetical protein
LYTLSAGAKEEEMKLACRLYLSRDQATLIVIVLDFTKRLGNSHNKNCPFFGQFDHPGTSRA